MTLGASRIVCVIAAVLVIPACASLPPERVARRAALDKAASECRVTFPVIVRYEIDSFDRLVYYYKEDVRHADRQPFLDCVQERVREAGVTLTPAGQTSPAPSSPPSSLVYPSDLRILSPSPSIAAERAGFSGHWLGSWNEQRSAPHALVVERIENTEAVVVFAAIGRSGPVWGRHRAKFTDDGGLRFTGREDLVATYRVQPDGTLFATMEWKGQIFRSRMTRRP